LYETDTPLAERRAQALTLDRELLRDLLGQEGLRDLLDPDAVAQVEAELQALTEDRRARDADEVVDLLRRLGDLNDSELAARAEVAPEAGGRRTVRVRIAGEERWIAADDAGRYRDALGVVPPAGLPSTFLAPVERALEGLLLRWARTHGPFLAEVPAGRWGLPAGAVRAVLDALVRAGTLLLGEIRPGGTHPEYCHPDVMRKIKRASLARLRNQVAAVDAAALARFLPAWHGIGPARRSGVDRLREVVAQLEGIPLPYSALVDVMLPSRIPGFDPSSLDVLGAMGELAWVGRGSLGRKDGKIVLVRRERAAAFAPVAKNPEGPLHTRIREHLETRGASFLAELLTLGTESSEVVEALWDLVWDGVITNDTFQPLRSLAGGSGAGPRGRVTLAGGRWGLVSRLGPPMPETERIYTQAAALLARYGVVSREMAQAEDLDGGFQGVYKVFRAMEESGRARRGWFVDGLGGAQFATPGAVDQLRAAREGAEPEVVALSAVDPALVWGALIDWPATTHPEARPRRVAGAVVVVVDGLPALFADRGGRTAWTFAGTDPAHLEAAARQLGQNRRWLGARTLRIELLDGVPARQAGACAALLRGGYAADHQGLAFVG
jgi:ATP-dependent Lhr-like helicase